MDYTLTFSMNIVPQVARRGRHALILLQNSAGKFVLGKKNIYPQGISRIIGGGVNENEEMKPAAARELQEETGLVVHPEDLLHLSTITANITEQSTGKNYQFVTYLFFYNFGDQGLEFDDDLDGLHELTSEELQQLIYRYQQLPTEVDQSKGFAWYDYGQLYGAIHQIALEELQRVQSV